MRKLAGPRRWLIEVWYLMLEALTKPMRSSHLAYALRLSNWKWVVENIEILEKAGFIARSPSADGGFIFSTTDEGQTFMECLGKLLKAKGSLQ